MPKTIKEINEKIKRGKAVVVTAEEVIDLVERDGVKKTAEKVDVVTTGTFSPMCSSGIYFNICHSKPRIKLEGNFLLTEPVAPIPGVESGITFKPLKERAIE